MWYWGQQHLGGFINLNLSLWNEGGHRGRVSGWEESVAAGRDVVVTLPKYEINIIDVFLSFGQRICSIQGRLSEAVGRGGVGILSAQSTRLITSASQTIYYNEISFYRHAHFESLIFKTSQWSCINLIIKLPLVNPDKYSYKWSATIMNSLDSRCAFSSPPPPHPPGRDYLCKSRLSTYKAVR